MRKRIAVIGAGTAGLHLGLRLRQLGVDVTLFSDRRPEEYKTLRLLNTVAHHHVTVEREDALGCNHWSSAEYGYFGHYYYVGGPQPLRFYGALEHKSRAVDYRIYQPRLMEDFAARGGTIEFREITHEDVSSLTRDFDLLVVCTGKGPFGQMFKPESAHSPFQRPQRALCVGLFSGIREPETRAVVMNFSPGAGEMIEIPTYSFGGMVTALVIENHIGGDLEILAKTPYAENPKAFLALLLNKLRKHYPDCANRIDESAFDLAGGPLDLLQGGVTPTVRCSHVMLEDGKLAIALGDVQAVVDPVLGQGANMASYAAVILAEEIAGQDVFDERFMERLEERRRDRVLCATRWTNYILNALGALDPDLLNYIGMLSQNPRLADEFTENFNYPERQWDCFATPDRIRAWLDSRFASSRPAALAIAG